MRNHWLAAGAALFVFTFVSAAGAKSDDTPPPSPQLDFAAPESVGFSSDKLKLLDADMDRAVDDGEVAGTLTLLVRHGKIVDLHMHGLKSI